MCSVVNHPTCPTGRADHLIVTPWEVDRLEFTGLRYLEPSNGTGLHLKVFGKSLSGWPHKLTIKANPEGTNVTFRLEESERAPELKQKNQPANTEVERAWYVQE